MSQIESIRVGNYFNFPFTKEVVKIVGFAQMEYDGSFKVQFEAQGTVLLEPLRTLTPIDITEEWVLNLGFQKRNFKISNSVVYSFKKWQIRYSIDNSTWYLGHDNTSPQSIVLGQLKYVHQIQNFIYFFTKSDLLYEV
jgi:hypothetical protein